MYYGIVKTVNGQIVPQWDNKPRERGITWIYQLTHLHCPEPAQNRLDSMTHLFDQKACAVRVNENETLR